MLLGYGRGSKDRRQKLFGVLSTDWRGRQGSLPTCYSCGPLVPKQEEAPQPMPRYLTHQWPHRLIVISRPAPYPPSLSSLMSFLRSARIAVQCCLAICVLLTKRAFMHHVSAPVLVTHNTPLGAHISVFLILSRLTRCQRCPRIFRGTHHRLAGEIPNSGPMIGEGMERPPSHRRYKRGISSPGTSSTTMMQPAGSPRTEVFNDPTESAILLPCVSTSTFGDYQGYEPS